MNSIYDICGISDLGRYIDILCKYQKDLLICAVARDTLYKINEKTVKKLQKLGMQELRDGGWRGYVYVNDQGVVKIDKKSEKDKSITEIYEVKDFKIELVSRSFRDGNLAKIIINAIDMAVNWRGLNIVVIDRTHMRLVDSICFDFFPNTLTPVKRIFCSYCSYMEIEKEKIREKQIKNILPLIHIAKTWASIKERDLTNKSRLIEKFDEGYHTVSILDDEGKYKGVVNQYQFKNDLVKGKYSPQTELYIEYNSSEDQLKWELARMFLNTPRHEIPIVKEGEIVALGRRCEYFDYNGLWDVRQVYDFDWLWLDKEVVKEFFRDKRRILISSNCGFLKGFKKAFSQVLNIEVYDDNVFEGNTFEKYDMLIYCSNNFDFLSIEKWEASKLYHMLLVETVRRWLDKQGVALHLFTPWGQEVPNIRKRLDRQGEWVGGISNVLQEGTSSYFISDGSNYDKKLNPDKRLPNFNSGRRCVKRADSYSGNGIYFFGPCTAVGWSSYSPDKNTESFLQEKLNEENINYHVVNCATDALIAPDATAVNWLYRLMDIPFRRGDVAVAFISGEYFWGREKKFKPDCLHKMITPFISEENIEKKCFAEPLLGHVNVTGCKILADYVFQTIKGDLKKECSSNVRYSFLKKHKLSISDNSVMIRSLLERLPQDINGDMTDIGAVVLHANPITNGHIHLLEKSLEQCSFLYVFLQESENPVVSFDCMKKVLETFAEGKPMSIVTLGYIVRQKLIWGLSVSCVISGETKEFDPVDDAYTFARVIAPKLGISKFFSCEATFDTFKHRYNILKREIMMEEGIEWIDIPRRNLADGRGIITSEIREKWIKNGWDSCKEYLPEEVVNALDGR